MKTKKQHKMFKETEVKTYYLSRSLDDFQRATIIFQVTDYFFI